MVKLLLSFHAPVNALDMTFGSSPLAWAFHGSRLNKAFLLSRPGADKEYDPVITALREEGGVEIPNREAL
jgi:hypothetical protein